MCDGYEFINIRRFVLTQDDIRWQGLVDGENHHRVCVLLWRVLYDVYVVRCVRQSMCDSMHGVIF